MKNKPFALAGAGCLALTSVGSAALVGVKMVNVGDLGAGADSWQIFLWFDNPLDQLLAINGDASVSPLIFDSPVPLIQNNVFEGIQAFDDVPSPADLGGDSWVVIGNRLTHNTSFSPNFLGGDGMESVIKGTHFEQLDNGGYFDENPGTAETPDENMQIMIAQFTLDFGPGDWLTFEGTANYLIGGQDLVAHAFQIGRPPSPGALALFGLAGVAGRRRRRV